MLKGRQGRFAKNTKLLDVREPIMNDFVKECFAKVIELAIELEVETEVVR